MQIDHCKLQIGTGRVRRRVNRSQSAICELQFAICNDFLAPRRTAVSFFVALVVALGAAASVHAQPPADPAAPAPAEAPQTRDGMADPNGWAPVPDGFYRGNMQRDSAGAYVVAGGYFSLVKLVLIVGAFLYWIHTSSWVAADSRALRLRPEFWNSIQLLGGTAAILAVLIFPTFLLGLLGLLALYGGSIGTYVYERNRHVPDSGKVLTPRHLQQWGIRQLARRRRRRMLRRGRS